MPAGVRQKHAIHGQDPNPALLDQLVERKVEVAGAVGPPDSPQAFHGDLPAVRRPLNDIANQDGVAGSVDEGEVIEMVHLKVLFFDGKGQGF